MTKGGTISEETRAKMSKAAKKRAKAMKAAKAMKTLTEKTEHGADIKQTPIFAYAFGHVEAWLEAYSKGAAIPYQTLAAELGKALQKSASR